MDEIQLHPLQQQAVDAGCNIENRVVAVTGPAGTGKTTIIRKIYQAAKDNGYNPVLCAPTGKAAKRIYEATGIPALTIHRLLEYSHPGDPDPKTGKPCGVSMPRRDGINPIEFDFVIGDEYAMVTEELHRNLFNALPRGGVIRVFGDDNQLAPVEEDKNLRGSPSPFRKILDDRSGKFVIIKLEQVFRQGADSGILANCQNILQRRYPTKNSQWDMVYTDLAVNAVKDYINESEEIEGHSFRLLENQIVVPQNKSKIGTHSLNLMIQGMFYNRSDDHMYIDRHSWVLGEGDEKGGRIRLYEGDKVVITQNIYDLYVFNGETGIVKELVHETGEVLIDFGDREQMIPPVLMVQNRHGTMSSIDPRRSIDLSYALTTHKVQGSEYRRGVYIINRSNSFMLSRRNFYTAASRFKEHLHLITDQRGLAMAMSKGD